MTVFNFTELVSDPMRDIKSAALGVDVDNGYVEADVGKVVKLSTAQNYVPAATGDDIEGFVDSLMPDTVNDGFSWGAVQRDGRRVVEVADAEAGTIAVGAYVVAGIQIALGTAGNPMVIAGAGSIYIWRVLRHVTGTGVSADLLLIERV